MRLDISRQPLRVILMELQVQGKPFQIPKDRYIELMKAMCKALRQHKATNGEACALLGEQTMWADRFDRWDWVK